jgi:Glycosyltransferase family 9 (heptosyltransferase).
VQVHEPLVPLFKRCSYIDSVITIHDAIPRVYKKFGICIASLMIKSKNMIPLTTPYLNADPALITYWHDRIAIDTHFKIGICISSNMVIDQWSGQHQANPRSIAAQELLFLTKIPGISLYNLHKDSADTQLLSPITFDDFDNSHGRFMDSAALMKNMDLIITVDTSIAHLAGALGAPTCLLLSTESDYRWLTDRHDSPYYPSLTIFRQNTINDWSSVTTELLTYLQTYMANTPKI